ncbi:diadenylate cyclase CdaA [Angelakisella massiliensis]|nr:diadenylate cyclase CdaA [Angelakisella massiliensis]
MTEATQIPQIQLMWDWFINMVTSIQLSDVLDMCIVAFLIYKMVGLVRDTRAGQLVKGVLAVLLLYWIAELFGFGMLRAVLAFILPYGAMVLLVLFQPELRKAMEQLGRSSISTISNIQLFGPGSEAKEQERQKTQQLIDAICESCAAFSKDKTGALIVLERETKLGDIISTGTIINSDPSPELIGNIFFHNAPLHDGALVVRENRLHSAGCFLPLSQNYEISRMLGTRHRAALGVSEVSDAVVVVVSEETGAITVALNGQLNMRLTPAKLKELLQRELIHETEEKKEHNVSKILKRVKK